MARYSLGIELDWDDIDALDEVRADHAAEMRDIARDEANAEREARYTPVSSSDFASGKPTDPVDLPF